VVLTIAFGGKPFGGYAGTGGIWMARDKLSGNGNKVGKKAHLIGRANRDALDGARAGPR